MARWMRRLSPFMALALSVLEVIDAVAAFGDDRLGRGAFKAFSGMMWLFLAYMLYETSKRIPTDSK